MQQVALSAVHEIIELAVNLGCLAMARLQSHDPTDCRQASLVYMTL